MKFYIPDILNEEDVALYLDGDIIVRSDISEIFSIDMAEYFVCAVSDMSSDEHKHMLGVSEYFNSGVMLLNLKKIRDGGFVRKLVDYRLNGYNRFMDQDTFNVVFRDNVKLIGFEYNTTYSTIGKESLENIIREYGLSGIRTNDDLFNNSKIFHFSGKKKPWKSYMNVLSKVYNKYVKMSPYSNCDLTYVGEPGIRMFSDNII